jgi:uncharacterized membrane protein YfcA
MDALTSELGLKLVAGAGAAGFVQGLSGFAYGLTAMGFWAWSLPPHLAGPLVVFGSLVGQLLSAPAIRRGFDLGRTLPFLAGGFVGVPIGVTMLRFIDPNLFKVTVAIVLLVYCPAMLFARDLPRITAGGRAADAGVGVLGGILSGIGGLPGPAPIIWCTLRGWDKDVQRAVFQPFFLAMHALTFASYGASGLLSTAMLPSFLVVALATVVPTVVGARLYRRFSDTGFRRAVLGLLALSGLVLLATTVPALLRSAPA